MKYRPSRLFVVCLASLALTGAAGAWAWKKANSVPMQVRVSSGFFESLTYRAKADFERPTEEERARTREAVRAFKAKLLTEFPELAITDRPVPDEENAFLQLHLMSGPPTYPGLALSHEALNFFSGKADWDAERAARLLKEHEEVVGEVERIAAMEERSSAGMPESYRGHLLHRFGLMGPRLPPHQHHQRPLAGGAGIAGKGAKRRGAQLRVRGRGNA